MGLRTIVSPGALPSGLSGNAATPESAGYPTVLNTDREFWVDVDAGNDGSNGAQATPWQNVTRFLRFCETFRAIDAVVTCWVANSGVGVASFESFTCPQLGTNGKIVFRASGDTFNGAAFTAAAGSTTSQIVASALPAGDLTGWGIVCTAGANVGKRSHIAIQSGSTLIPNCKLSAAGVGDTWR